jgi:hypothetical protein
MTSFDSHSQPHYPTKESVEQYESGYKNLSN